ncbi:GNAT family N-acetyltransferase [bacterium]|nr:GNAT family N-acetyltransferase [bacterium]
MSLLILSVRIPEDLETVCALFREYAGFLGHDLCFQDFEKELAELPGDYGPPEGCLLIAWMEHQPVGCVALRPFSANACEMKRLYLRPEGRGKGYGRLLAERIVEEARRIGYERMALDTVESLESAVRLYEKMGFRRIPPYRHNPLPDPVFMELDLRRE